MRQYLTPPQLINLVGLEYFQSLIETVLEQVNQEKVNNPPVFTLVCNFSDTINDIPHYIQIQSLVAPCGINIQLVRITDDADEILDHMNDTKKNGGSVNFKV